MDSRVILKFNMNIGRELVALHSTPSMYDKFSMHAWRWWRGGLSKEHSIMAFRGPSSFWHARH